MRLEGCKDGYIWTTVTSGTCAKAVCLCLSQRQHGVGCHCVTVIALHYCGKSHFKIFKPLKPLKILRMVICRAIKHYEELWSVEDRAHAGRLKSVRAEAAIKMVWERIRQNPSWKQKIMSRKLNISNTSSLASSGTVYAWERTAAQRDTSLLLLWRSSSGQEQSVSFSGMPRTGTKHPLHGRENLHHWGAVQQPEQQVLCLNIPWGVFRGCRWVFILSMSWFVGGCPIRGWHLFIFVRKEWNWCLSVWRGSATRSCETS